MCVSIKLFSSVKSYLFPARVYVLSTVGNKLATCAAGMFFWKQCDGERNFFFTSVLFAWEHFFLNIYIFIMWVNIHNIAFIDKVLPFLWYRKWDHDTRCSRQECRTDIWRFLVKRSKHPKKLYSEGRLAQNLLNQ